LVVQEKELQLICRRIIPPHPPSPLPPAGAAIRCSHATGHDPQYEGDGAQHLLGIGLDLLLQGFALLQMGFDQGFIFWFHGRRLLGALFLKSSLYFLSSMIFDLFIDLESSFGKKDRFGFIAQLLQR